MKRIYGLLFYLMFATLGALAVLLCAAATSPTPPQYRWNGKTNVLVGTPFITLNNYGKPLLTIDTNGVATIYPNTLKTNVTSDLRGLIWPNDSINQLGRTRLEFDVRCPECGIKEVRTSKAVHLEGSYATTVNGVEGFMQRRTASFRCDSCRNDFDSPVRPDKFVPLMPAVPIEIYTNLSSLKTSDPLPVPRTNILPFAVTTVVTTVADPVPRHMTLSDGTVMELVQRVTPSANGPEVLTYHRK